MLTRIHIFIYMHVVIVVTHIFTHTQIGLYVVYTRVPGAYEVMDDIKAAYLEDDVKAMNVMKSVLAKRGEQLKFYLNLLQVCVCAYMYVCMFVYEPFRACFHIYACFSIFIYTHTHNFGIHTHTHTQHQREHRKFDVTRKLESASGGSSGILRFWTRTFGSEVHSVKAALFCKELFNAARPVSQSAFTERQLGVILKALAYIIDSDASGSVTPGDFKQVCECVSVCVCD
jgi:hypothetical protein